MWGCLQQRGLAVHVWRETYHLGNSLGCLGISMGPLWPATQLYVTQSWYWKLLLVIRDELLGLCLLHYLETSLGPPSYILGCFCYTRFLYHSLNAHRFLLSLPALLPLAHPTSPTQPNLPIPVPHCSQYTYKIYFTFPFQGNPLFPPAPSSRPNFSRSMDCS